MNYKNILMSINKILLFLILFCGISCIAQEKVVTLTFEKAKIIAKDLEKFKFTTLELDKVYLLVAQQDKKIEVQDTIIKNQDVQLKLKDIIIESKQEQIKIYKNKSLGNKILLYGSLLLSGYLIVR